MTNSSLSAAPVAAKMAGVSPTLSATGGLPTLTSSESDGLLAYGIASGTGRPAVGGLSRHD